MTSAPSTAAADDLRQRAERFIELHRRPGAFVIPNPWDAGTARVFEILGFEALATTGAGFAFSVGRPDGQTIPDELIEYVASIARATTLPVSADLEDGFGVAPDTAAQTIATVAGRGVVGGSIEDRHYRDDQGGRMFDIAHASDRIRAAAETARALPFRFTLTARCECFLVGEPDIAETIRRLQAYQEAGADVLYAPGAMDRDHIHAITSSVDRPVNVVMGLTPHAYTLDELAALGVSRVSLGSTLSRVAFGATVRAAEQLLAGSFTFAESPMPYARLNGMLATGVA